MIRKLVKHGEATLMISLPAKWLKNNNLGKGDELEVLEKTKELILSSEAAAKNKKETAITITEENKHDLYPLLTHAYRKGFDKIILRGNISEISKEAKSITNNLLFGFEITEKREDKILIENVSEPEKEKYEIIMKKVFMAIRDSHELLVASLKNSNFNMPEMQENRNLTDRYALFCRRIIVKESKEEASEWEFLTFLTHIEHAYYYLYKYLTENKIHIERPILELVSELAKYFDLLQSAYETQDIQSIHKINILKNKFQFGRCLELIKKSKGNEAVVYSYMREIFRLIQLSSSPVLNGILDTKD